MTRAAVYIRVSTSESSTENQFPQIQRFAEGRGYEIAEVYQEEASAWKSGSQRELSRLLLDIKSGRRHYDKLLVWALDRLSRQGARQVLELIHTFASYGVKVESVQEPFTTLPYGFDDVIYSFLGWMAKFESDRTSQRTKEGVERARQKGKRLGRPPDSKDTHRRRRSGYYLRYKPDIKYKKWGGQKNYPNSS